MENEHGARLPLRRISVTATVFVTFDIRDDESEDGDLMAEVAGALRSALSDMDDAQNPTIEIIADSEELEDEE